VEEAAPQWYPFPMRVPQWLTLGVAALVIFFGAYRLRLALRSAADEEKARQRKGMWGMPRRTHALVGTVYLLLGAALVATSFGWNPLAGALGGGSAPPPTAPADHGAVPVQTK